jgi:Domain of unknown function (DUF4189)
MKLLYKNKLNAKSKATLLLLISLLSLSFVAHAEGNCPPGYFPTTPPGQPGPQGCAPMPNNSQDSAQLSGPRWATRWGAIATDPTTGALGTVTGISSKRKAEKAALADCQAKGGKECKLQLAYDNECAAMIVGNNVFNVTADTTLQKAIQSGTKKCSDQDSNCHVFYSACSPPEQIQ